ncbi:hypothetical protein [Nonomuraea dietziae]|uniref:hypothetical protein n=1 Tax=Nonomuraea dietziae TaxID=65515 RepID=UPI00341BE6B4
MTRRRTPRTSVIRLTTGQAARTLRHPYSLHPPILALDFGATSVLITMAEPVTVDDLKFARQLACEASHFVLTLERRFGQADDQRAAA